MLWLAAFATAYASGQESPADDPLAVPARDRYEQLRAEYGEIRGDSEEERKRRQEVSRAVSEAINEMRAQETLAIQHLFQQRQDELAQRQRAMIVAGRKLGLDALNYPRIDGSTSTHPLSVLIACRLLGVDWEWVNPHAPAEPPHVTPGMRHFPSMSLWDKHESITRAQTKPASQERVGQIINRVLVQHSGTHGAYLNVITGERDLGLIARRPSESELTVAAIQGVELEIRPIARDAFVFFVDRTNPFTTLSTEQIKRIYQDKIKNWSELGGRDEEISALRRNPDSGSEELMRTVFMKDAYDAVHGLYIPLHALSMSGPFERLAQDRNSIAYTVYYYQHFMATSPYARLLAVDGVAPSSATIRSAEYPYITQVYAVLRADTPADSKARLLRDWLLSEEGQRVVEESGYVPLR